jgi:DNA-binding FadR family transcriptional regulator
MDSLIHKKSLADEVAERLQKQISSGLYKVGEKLPTEPQLMSHFGVGRSTIREAIKLLSNLGLLNVQQGLGTFVERQTPANEPLEQRLKRADVQELLEVRQILEFRIAELAAIKRTAKDIANMERLLEERKVTGASGELNKCIEADIRFHNAIAEATHNEILFELYKSASSQLEKHFKYVFTNTNTFTATQHTHEQLMKQIAAGEPQKALKAAEKIINHT